MSQTFIELTHLFSYIIWNSGLGTITQSALRRTTLLQKQAIRIINNAKYNSHTGRLYRKSHVMKLTDLLEYQASLCIWC